MSNMKKRTAQAAAKSGPKPRKDCTVVQLLDKLRRGADVRSRKTRRLRGAVRANRYENDLKLTIALEKLLADL